MIKAFMCTADKFLLASICTMLGSSAHATAYGFASSVITNLHILVDSGSMDVLAGANRSNVNQTTYNDSAGPSGSNSTTGAPPVSSDAAQAFSGPNAMVVPENSYTANAGRSAGLVGARSDSNTGTGNSITPNGGAVSGGGTGLSMLNTVAEALVNAGNVATSDGRVTGAAQLRIQVDTPVTLHLTFTEEHTLSATTTNLGDVAQTVIGTDFEFTGPSDFSYVPPEINITQSSVAGGGNIATSGTAFFSSPEATLQPGLYSFARRTESQIDVQSLPIDIPEPAPLVLLGSGLVACGLLRLRWKRPLDPHEQSR